MDVDAPLEFVVFSTPTCKFCDKAKDYFDMIDANYANVNIEEDKEAAAFFRSMNWMTVPQICSVVESETKDGLEMRHIGGYNDLLKYMRRKMQ